MFTYRKTVKTGSELLVSFDLEWTKNFRIANPNRPFCFSFVYFTPPHPHQIDENLEFGFALDYVESNEETPQLVRSADQLLGELASAENTTVVGHQLSSDISVVTSCPRSVEPINFIHLRESWRGRHHTATGQYKVFDTRYDLDHVLENKSRRLVDICVECNLSVVQTELSPSMTGMHNDFLATHRTAIMERLAVVNLRHSLSAAILYTLFHPKYSRPGTTLNVNRILYNNVRDYFEYVRSSVFEALI